LFDLKTVPDIVIKEISYNGIEVIKDKDRPKTYQLFNKGKRWMILDQFTNREIKEFYSSYDMAYGDVLITGFGFGFLATWVALKPDVKSVTIIESEQGVIDVFLMNNSLPKKITLVVADASTYKTDKQFDCILLDHYEENTHEEVFTDMRKIAANIPNHNLIWAWSLEVRLAVLVYNLGQKEPIASSLNNYYNFHEKYDFFKNEIVKVGTLPNLPQAKINDYVYTYFGCLGYSSVL
jgi:hypothetical protein